MMRFLPLFPVGMFSLTNINGIKIFLILVETHLIEPHLIITRSPLHFSVHVLRFNWDHFFAKHFAQNRLA